MNGGALEFVFWALLFVLCIGAGVIAWLVERKSKPHSPWLEKFHERNS